MKLSMEKEVGFKRFSQKRSLGCNLFSQKRTEVSFKPFLLRQVSFENANNTELSQQINKLMEMGITSRLMASALHIHRHTTYLYADGGASRLLAL